MRRLWAAALGPMILATSCSGKAELSTLDRVVADACAAEIVLLGESAHHGDGEAQAFKAALLDRMLDACPPKLIAFEASTYEVERFGGPELVSVAACPDGRICVRSGRNVMITRPRPVTDHAVATALGHKWNRNAEMQPVIARLAAWIKEGGNVVGLDDQVGAVGQDYSNDQIAIDLTERLQPEPRAMCRDVLRRRIYFAYDDDHPRDAAERERLQICADLIAMSAPYTAGVTRPFMRYLRRDALPREARSVDRNASMFASFERAYHGGRAVIWGATVHTARHPDRLGGRVASSHDNVYSLGFSAIGGSYRRMDSAVAERPELPDDAVERLGPGYLDRAALRDAGKGQGAVFGTVQSRDWSELQDGLVVFETERATEPAS